QQITDSLGGIIEQACEQVREPGLRIDVVELGGFGQRVDGGGTTAAVVRPGEGPVVAANGDAAQNALGSVIRHAQAAVLDEGGACGPVPETVVDRLGGIALR